MWPLTSDVIISLWSRAGSEEEAQALSKALLLLKELISSVDKEVLELDRTRRLQEIQARLDPRAEAEVRAGGVFRGGELMRRRLLHEGMLLWKVQGSRMKGCLPAVMSYWDVWAWLLAANQPNYVCFQMCKSCWCQTSWFSFRRKIRSSLLHHWWVTTVCPLFTAAPLSLHLSICHPFLTAQQSQGLRSSRVKLLSETSFHSGCFLRTQGVSRSGCV